jgi:ribosome-associated heat shock protein Hsp15
MSENILRIDKWLWYARFFKSRSLASQVCAAGKVRVNKIRVLKAHANVRIGDVLTFPQAKLIRVVKILALGHRRGPAPEARLLYEDLAPVEAGPQAVHSCSRGMGRPTKANRRALDRLRGDSIDSSP